MLDVNSYIKGGRVQRSKIASDIQYGNLTERDISILVADERVRSAFNGTSYDKKVPSSEWTESYLDELSYAAVEGTFNEDYLRYLYEVATYVNSTQDKKSSKGVVIVAVVAVAVVALVVWLIVSNGSKAVDVASGTSS